MTLHWIDHVFFVLLVLVFPVTEFFAMRRQAARIHAGEPGQRMVLYRRILREEWAEVAVFLGAWFVLDRGSAELGLVPEGGLKAWIGYALAAALCAALLVQARVVIASSENRATVREQIGWLSFLMPHTLRERRTFDLVAVTAGVCEEILFRGFVIAYLVALLPIGFWPAAAASGLLFGLAHAYQGPTGAARAGVVGLVMGALFGLTGSLWAPIVAHSIMDLTSGRIGYASAQDAPPSSAPPCPAA